MIQEEIEFAHQGIRDSWVGDIQLLLVPVYAAFHWTLLVAEKSFEGIQRRRYDSLSQEHNESHAMQIRLGKLLDSNFVLPPLSNYAKQPVGSNACGNYVLHYMEKEIRLRMREWPSVWPEEGWTNWQLRLRHTTEKLRAHWSKSEQEVLYEAAQLKSQREQVAKTLKKAQEKMKNLKDVTSSSWVMAEQSINHNSQKFTWKNLSDCLSSKGSCASACWEDLQEMQMVVWLLRLRPLEEAQVPAPSRSCKS